MALTMLTPSLRQAADHSAQISRHLTDDIHLRVASLLAWLNGRWYAQLSTETEGIGKKWGRMLDVIFFQKSLTDTVE